MKKIILPILLGLMVCTHAQEINEINYELTAGAFAEYIFDNSYEIRNYDGIDGFGYFFGVKAHLPK